MADLHLGSPFRGLHVREPDAARRFAQAIRDTFTDLVSRAVEAQVDFVVIAGDVYDGQWKDASVGLFFNREMARLDRAGIPVFLVKGNHDAASVVTRSVSLPKSVRTFGVSRATTVKLPHLSVALHGQSYKERETVENLAQSYPDAVPGHFNIGVLHTSLAGSAEHATYAPCSEADLLARGYDYWALGHIHVPQVVRERPPIVYSGCIQGRSVRETGAHGAMLVRVRAGEPSLEPWIADRARWAVASVDAGGLEDAAAFGDAVARAAGEAVADAGDRPIALRVRVHGRTALHPWLHGGGEDVRDAVEAACAHASAETWLEKVVVDTAPLAAAPSMVPDLEEAATMLSLLDAANDAALHPALQADRTALLAKLPGGASDAAGDDAFDASAVLADARALLGARLGGEG